MRSLSGAALLALRVVLVAIGAAGVAWSVSVLSGLRGALHVHDVAERILTAEKIPPEGLPPLLSYLDRHYASGCPGPATVAAASIRIYVATSAVGASAPEAPQRLAEARHSIRQSLACSPYEPFLWYALFWVEMTQGASREQYLKYLEFSYTLGPREGWIAYYRNVDALAQFHYLSASAQDRVREEYLHLVKDQPPVAAASFRDTNEAMRSQIMAWVADLPIDQRRHLAAALDAADVVADVPGVVYQQGKVVMKPKREGAQ